MTVVLAEGWWMKGVLVVAWMVFTLTAEVTAQSDPVLLGPGVISTDAIEYGPAYSPSGDTLYFTRRRSFDDAPQIYWSQRLDGGWSDPVPVPFAHPAGDEFPSFSADGRRLYFASARPVNGVNQQGQNDLWSVQRRPDGWGEPVHIGGDLSTPGVDSHPVVTDAGIFFHSRRAGGVGAVDAYFAPGPPDQWSTPTLLPFSSEATDGEVVPVPGEDAVVFYSDREGGAGRGDLYLVERREGVWGQALNLGRTVNTPAWEWSPTFDPQGRLVFARLSGDGSDSDLFVVGWPVIGLDHPPAPRGRQRP